MVARTAVDPATLIDAAKLAIWEIDPLQTFYRTATLEELVDRTLITRRFALIVLTGIRRARAAARGRRPLRRAEHDRRAVPARDRRAHGARRRVAGHPAARRGRGLVVSAVGVAVGLVGVIGGARLLRGFLFSVTPTDPIAIGGAAMLMLAIAAIACYIPARRAAGEDPVQALRVE